MFLLAEYVSFGNWVISLMNGDVGCLSLCPLQTEREREREREGEREDEGSWRGWGQKELGRHNNAGRMIRER